MALGEVVAQHTWKGRESRGNGGKQAHTKQTLTFSTVVTHVPSAVPKFFPPLPFIALSQFFVPWPHMSFFRAVHTHCDRTNSRDKGFVLLAHSTLQSLLTPRSRSEIRYRSETSDQLLARHSGVSGLIITNHNERFFCNLSFTDGFIRKGKGQILYFQDCSTFLMKRDGPGLFNPPPSKMLFLFSRNIAALENRSLPLSVRIQCPI